MQRGIRVPLAMAVSLVLNDAAPAQAQSSVTLPVGTTIELKMETPLASDRSRKGESFRTSVLRSIWVDGQLAVPVGTVVEGRVDTVRGPARGISGTIEVDFVRLTLPGQTPVEVKGVLTSLKDDERRTIADHDKVGTGRAWDVIFIGDPVKPGERASTLVGIAGRDDDPMGKDWAQSGLGPEVAQVAAGSIVAMTLDAPLTLKLGTAAGTRQPGDRHISVADATVTAVQSALRERRYLRGAPSGKLDPSTRSAVTLYQLDQKQLPTGDLEEVTLVSLGVVDARGRSAVNAPAH